jgi:hypothetical protein
MSGLGSAAPLKNGNALLEGSKPLFELCGGITAENALSEHRLADGINALGEFFVIPLHFGLEPVHFPVERPNCTPDFLEQTQRMVLRFRHRSIPITTINISSTLKRIKYHPCQQNIEG